MRPPKPTRAGLPLLLALASVAILPITTLAGDVQARETTFAQRGAVAPATGPISYGSDGRFTLLLLGSDFRPHHGGERTDVVMVVSIDPGTHRVAIANLPRDMVYIPRAGSNGGGTSGTNRINAMYEYYRRPLPRYPAVDLNALKKFKADVATLLATQIDYVAMVRFTGFSDLISLIGGVDVRIANAIRDSFYKAPGEYGNVRGVYFPVATTWHLDGDIPCKPYPKKCHNGLAYARSRHGFVGSGYNSDFQRGHRQQFLVKAGADKIVQSQGGNLSSLVGAVQGRVFTDLPRTLDAATQLYNLATDATLSTKDTVVFSPSKWATEGGTVPIYTFRPKLPAIRTWINQHFGS